MDQIKIGKFIQERRKLKGLTQEQLAEKMLVSDRAVSKWERGLNMPDSSIMLELSEVLGISVTELLTGHLIEEKNIMKEAEEKLVDQTKDIERANKRTLILEVIVIILTVCFALSLMIIAAIVLKDDQLPWRIVCVASSLVVLFVSSFSMLALERKTGSFLCKECQQTFVPTKRQFWTTIHFGFNHYMKCPHCGKISWKKKVLK